MDLDKANEARSLLCDLNTLNDIQSVLEKEDNHWWRLLTSDTGRWNENGVQMPEILREEFVEAVQRFGEDFIRAIADFNKCVTEYTESIAKTLVQIGDDIDKALGYDLGVAVSHIVDILDRNEKFRKIAENLITLYGLDGIRMLYYQLFPEHLYGGRTYSLVNTYRPEYFVDIIKPKPYDAYSSKYRSHCKPIPGFKRQNQWKRIRSNPKLR